MRAAHGLAAVFLAAAMLAVVPAPARAQQKPAGPQTAAEADDAYPKAYVCKNIQYTQVDDKPGACTADKTPLIPIRLGIAYKCLHGPSDIQATEGQCRYDHLPKGPVTVSVFWTCKAAGDRRYPDPGKCADGTPREIGFEERPHGDHNPRHGAPAIFMSADLFHHIEGTYVAPGIFRVYFYNEFTKPMKATGFTGRVALTDANAAVTGPMIPLKPSNIPDGNAMEAQIPNAPVPSKDAIVHIKLFLKFKAGDADFVTDHTFPAYSKDTTPAKPADTTTGAARGTQPRSTAKPPAAAGRAAQPVGAASTTARTAAPKPAPGPAASAPAPVPDVASAPAGTPMAGGAEVSAGPTGAQVVLPEKTPDLLAFLKQNAASVNDLLNEGELGAMWNPALAAKDAGLALVETHLGGLNDSQKARLASAVKQLTVLAWQIDAAGDLGNREQLGSLTTQFQTAVTDILAVYGQ